LLVSNWEKCLARSREQATAVDSQAGHNGPAQGVSKEARNLSGDAMLSRRL
jgi:hypothetical protein